MQSPAKLKSKSTKNHTPTTTTITTTTAQRTQRAQQAPYNAGDTVFFGLEKRRTAERIHAIQLQRDSKTVLISELKAFGRNFKLSTPVPEDLMPILGKGGKKLGQVEEKNVKNAKNLREMTEDGEEEWVVVDRVAEDGRR
ncbi:hypothetical protein BU26DRAFT_606166 [Trematosphaeria pertusa]|uniref:Uncharacterized protein n=1 Tax=Trematosphaeria pertusa TaxID=390896 RepID=A0A6A6I993_9PLEO|nr:uncharacterized protein BU26DRAFT_606166 [Trematosphaeria pertusa]KAF2247144.1 hypothetical protein BU26DRAFT_606166 [Trematosphaeria pertusa]